MKKVVKIVEQQITKINQSEEIEKRFESQILKEFYIKEML